MMRKRRMMMEMAKELIREGCEDMKDHQLSSHQHASSSQAGCDNDDGEEEEKVD